MNNIDKQNINKIIKQDNKFMNDLNEVLTKSKDIIDEHKKLQAVIINKLQESKFNSIEELFIEYDKLNLIVNNIRSNFSMEVKNVMQ